MGSGEVNDTICIVEYGRTQQYMQVSMTFLLRHYQIFGDEKTTIILYQDASKSFTKQPY
jgi:hypothetical protein